MLHGLETLVALEFLLIFSTALLLSMAATPGLIRVGYHLRILDLPDSATATGFSNHKAAQAAGRGHGQPADAKARKVHTQATPRLGGISIVLGSILSVAIWDQLSPYTGVLICSLMMFLTGFIDDIRNLNARSRLTVQITVASAAVYLADLSLDSLAWTAHSAFELPEFFGFIMSVFIIVGAINAINLIDGLDGLAGGVVFIGVALLSYCHFLNARDFQTLLLISFPIMGALLGFLRFNSHPASIFMGDGGSCWLGFMLGVLLLLTLNKASFDQGVAVAQPGAHVPLLSGVLCLGLPVVDTLFVILKRIRRGESPFSADKNHFHHTLLSIGLNQSQSVLAIYFISLLVGVAGLLPVAFPRYSLDVMPYISTAMLVTVMLAANTNILARVLSPDQRAHLTWTRHSFSPEWRRFIRHWEGVNRYTIYALIGIMPFFAGVPPKELGVACALAAACVALSMLFQKRESDFIQHIIMILGCCVLLTVLNINNMSVFLLEKAYSFQNIYNILYMGLFVSTLLYIAITFRKQYLKVNPTDFLLVVVPFLLLLVPDPWNTQYKLSTISLRALILFVAMRTMVKRQYLSLRKIKLVLLGGLSMVAAVSLLGLRLIYN